VAFAADGVREFQKLAGEVRSFQRVSGATAEDASRFVAVFDDLGISAEVGAKAISKMTRDLDTGKLQQFGVEIAKNKDGTTDLTETLLNVADAYARTTDPAQRAEMRFAAFGKQGDQLIPVLEKGRKGLDEFFKGAEKGGQILDQKDLDKAEDFRLAMDALNDAQRGLKMSLGEGLIPALTQLATGAATATDALDRITKPIGGLAGIVSGTTSHLIGGAGWLGVFGDKSKDAGDKAGEAGEQVDGMGDASDEASGKVAKLTEAEKAAIKVSEDRRKAILGIRDAVIELFNSDLSYRNSIEATNEGLRTLYEKQVEVAEATRQHGAKSIEAHDAQIALGDALRGVEGDMLGQAAAAVRLAEDQAKANGTTLTAEQRTSLYLQELEKLRQNMAPGSPLIATIDGYISKLRAIPSTISTGLNIIFPKDFHVSGSGNVQYRAHGGPVSAGFPYIVGEQGPELFVPGKSGTIVPNGAGGATINVYPPATMSPDEVARALVRWLKNGGTIPGLN